MPKKRTVLVVDDDADIRSTLTSELAWHGYEVEAVSDGREAIDSLSAKQVDVVLLDINMPKANGFKVLEFMKSNATRSRVIMLSALTDFEYVSRTLNLDAQDFVPKPFTVDEVVKAIERVLIG